MKIQKSDIDKFRAKSDPLAGSFDFSNSSAKEFFMKDFEVEYPEDSDPRLKKWMKSLEAIDFNGTPLENRAIDLVPGAVARRYNVMPVQFIGNNALAIAVSEELKVSDVLDAMGSLNYILKHPIVVKYKASSEHLRKTIKQYYNVPDIGQPAIPVKYAIL